MIRIGIADTGFVRPTSSYPSNEDWFKKFNLYWPLKPEDEFWDAVKKQAYDPSSPPSHFWNDDHNNKVADIIASIIDDEISYSFVHMNVFTRDTNDPYWSTLKYIINAIDHARATNCQFLNLSLGDPKIIVENGKIYHTSPRSDLPVFQEALRQYVKAGGIPVIAAGNSYTELAPHDCGNWLADDDLYNICVSAHTKEGEHAEFSSATRTVDVSAIGTELNLVGCYDVKRTQGTSFSTPQVLAVLAALYGHSIDSAQIQGEKAIEWAVKTIEQIATKPVNEYNEGESPDERADELYGTGSLSRTIEWFRLRSKRELLREELFGKHIYNYGPQLF